VLPPSYLDAVVAIGTREQECAASGFLYSYLLPGEEDVEEGKKKVQIYLVTNRHVFEGLDEVTVRLNPKGDESARSFSLTLNDRMLAFPHPDPKIDVAIVPTEGNWLGRIGLQHFYFRDDLDVAFTKQLASWGVSEGQSVYVLGFPLGLIAERNFVIVRHGTLARVRDAFSGGSHEYLVDSFIFPGNSGGPVVLDPGRETQGEAPGVSPRLIGMISGYIPYHEEAVSSQTGLTRVVFEENSGLASVIPIDYVQDCIVRHQQEATKLGLTKAYDKSR
jgi:S1-C subfamily serine protease